MLFCLFVPDERCLTQILISSSHRLYTPSWQYLFAFQELQRRLDQTLGKPGSYLAGIDRVGNVKPMTVGARLYRVEQQLSVMDKKIDQIIHGLNSLAHKPYAAPAVAQQPSTSIAPHMSSQHGPLTTLVPLASIEDDV